MLLTKWVGQAWEEVSANKQMIKRTFRKCGISVPIDGSADDEIQLEGLADYTVQEDGVDEGDEEDEDNMEAEMDDDDDDPFVNLD